MPDSEANFELTFRHNNASFGSEAAKALPMDAGSGPGRKAVIQVA